VTASLPVAPSNDPGATSDGSPLPTGTRNFLCVVRDLVLPFLAQRTLKVHVDGE
jgi:hypothetical protein